MSPLRIIILIILLYIGYRLITGGRKEKVTGKKRTSPREVPSSDTLVEDPVCKKLVPKQQAVVYETAGQTHYFCSEQCCETFRKQDGEQ